MHLQPEVTSHQYISDMYIYICRYEAHTVYPKNHRHLRHIYLHGPMGVAWSTGVTLLLAITALLPPGVPFPKSCFTSAYSVNREADRSTTALSAGGPIQGEWSIKRTKKVQNDRIAQASGKVTKHRAMTNSNLFFSNLFLVWCVGLSYFVIVPQSQSHPESRSFTCTDPSPPLGCALRM